MGSTSLLPVEVIIAYVQKRGQGSANISRLKLGDYHEQKVPLGRVLDEKLGTSVFSEGQTIKNKSGVCTFCVEFMRENPEKWSLTPEAQRLCEQLVAFIDEASGLPSEGPKSRSGVPPSQA